MSGVSLIGSSPAFARVLQLIEKLAKLSAPVLIEGETGTGKDMAARVLHYSSRRRDLPFVPINCGGFPDSLFESELFGHVKGAFTDAHMDRPGLVDTANSGTLFLDEVDALTPKSQVAILRFLQDGSFRPVGSRVERHADVRIVAASNANLDRLAESGAFRTDLLFRLRILNLNVPPLRERGNDALLLARAFFDKCRRQQECRATELDESSCVWFHRYHWPGNVRELEGLIYREAMMCDDALLRVSAPLIVSQEAPQGGEAGLNGIPYSVAKSKALDRFAREYLTGLMDHAGGNITHAARVAGKERRALGRLLRKHGLDRRGLGQS
jgi:DNA-binding NtrC family response regulator